MGTDITYTTYIHSLSLGYGNLRKIVNNTVFNSIFTRYESLAVTASYFRCSTANMRKLAIVDSIIVTVYFYSCP